MFERRDTRQMPLEEKVQLLFDEREIRDVIARDNRGRSRGDNELIKDCFWEEAWDHHQPWFDAPAHQAYSGNVRSADLFEMVQYMSTQMLIEIDGDVARVESYALSAKVFPERSGTGQKLLRLSGIRNLDRFERRNGEWRIAERQLLPEWGFFQEVPPIQKQISVYGPGTDANFVTCDPNLTVIKGSISKEDPSYSQTYSFMVEQ